MNIRTANDASLVQASLSGKKEPFVEIVTRYQALVTGVALGILNDFAASEDAAQETFIIAWKKLSTLKEPSRLKSWLAQIARNTATSQLRKKRETTQVDSLPLIDAQLSPDELASAKEERRQVLNALENLPEQLRLPLVLFYREGQSIRAVSETLDLTPDVTKKRLAKGRALLRGRIADLIDSVLLRTTPGTGFTATVAGAVGIVSSPEAIAATAFSASQKTTLAAMTSSKTATVVLVTALCLPLGYSTHLALNGNPDPQNQVAVPITSLSPKRSHALPQSEILKEWERLKAEYGTSPDAFVQLYELLNDEEESLRKSGLQTMLALDWASIDAHSACQFLRDKHHSMMRVACNSWIERDVERATDFLMSLGENWDLQAVDYLSAIGAQSPECLARVFEALPPRWTGRMDRHFAKAVEVDLTRTRIAVENMKSPYRIAAIRGLCAGWAKEDPHAALVWIKESLVGDELRRALGEVYLSWAEEDPFAVLPLLREARGVASNHNGPLPMQVFYKSARKNLGAALDWQSQNPTAIKSYTLKGAIQSELIRRPAEALSQLHQRDMLGLIEEKEWGEPLHLNQEQIKEIESWLDTNQPQDNIEKIRALIEAQDKL